MVLENPKAVKWEDCNTLVNDTSIEDFTDKVNNEFLTSAQRLNNCNLRMMFRVLVEKLFSS